MADLDNLSPRAKALLSALRGDFPDLPITSGYRDPDHNARVGGAKGSRHTHGDAIDISTRGMDDAQKNALLQAAWGAGARGIGIYPNGSLHFDVRPNPAFWGVGGSYRGADPSAAPTWARDTLVGLFNGGGAPGGGGVQSSAAAPVQSPQDAVDLAARPGQVPGFVSEIPSMVAGMGGGVDGDAPDFVQTTKSPMASMAALAQALGGAGGGGAMGALGQGIAAGAAAGSLGMSPGLGMVDPNIGRRPVEGTTLASDTMDSGAGFESKLGDIVAGVGGARRTGNRLVG